MKRSRVASLVVCIVLVMVVGIYTINPNLFRKSKEIHIPKYNADNTTLSEEYKNYTIPISKGRIVFKEKNYLRNIAKLMYNFDEYHGMEVQIEGFIHKEEDSQIEDFIVSRHVLVCCEEDMEMVGLKCLWDGDIPEINTWVRIIGNLQSYSFFHEELQRQIQEPLIIVERMEIIPPPRQQFIIP